MATWADLASYVRANYKISEERPDRIKLVFDLGDMRSQLVVLWRLTLANDTEEWVQIESPIGDVNSVDVARALKQVSSTVCGGLAQFGDLVTFRHSVPLLNLNINEFERPLLLVTATADDLERSLVGGDSY